MTIEIEKIRSIATAPKRCAITPQQARLWTETRVAFLYSCPAFAHILYSLMTHGEDSAYWTEEVPIAATDDLNLFLNPERFFKYNLQERVFVVAHEVSHAIFNHCGLLHLWRKRNEIGYADGTKLPFDQDTMNRALDYFINAMLIDSQVGKFNADWLHDPKYTTAMSPLDIYRDLFENGDKGKGQGFDIHLQPGTGQGQDPTQAQQDRQALDNTWKTEVASAIASAKAQGKLPAGLARHFTEVLEPQVAWQEHIRGLFARKVGSGSSTWRTPNRRLIARDPDAIYAPGSSGHATDTVVVAIDTSGSVNDKTIAMFLAELSGIVDEVSPKRTVVMWCDAEVGRVDEVEDAADIEQLRRKDPPGGAGTSFVPVFEEVQKLGLEPDALVYLTDGYGTFPEKPAPYPVFWGSIALEEKGYPWGDVVMIPKQAE
jgi:predicted metal-dependent peptidase